MNENRRYWDVVTAIAAVAAFIISVLALIEASDDDTGSPTPAGQVATSTPTTAPRPSGDDETEADDTSSPDSSDGAAGEIRAELDEFTITLAPAEIAPGSVVIEVTNEGAIVHNLFLDDGDAHTRDLQAGESANLDLGALPAGEYLLFCDIPGHREAGMESTLTVREA